MNITELKLQYNVCKASNDGLPVIIVAAGRSSRMNGINKQFVSLLGIPVIARTLMAFENCAEISKIIVVTAETAIAEMQLICDKYMISKVTDIVSGGNCRHDSVMNGMARLDTSDKKVLIHDGARPLVERSDIAAVAAALKEFDAALCVHKINDTVKKVDENGVVISTVDRKMLYGAQTPQGVDVLKYKSACESIKNICDFTDDASVMEEAGYTVKAITGSNKNIKITTPDDIVFAESLLKGDNDLCE